MQIIESDFALFLIMEYAPGGEVFDLIVKKGRLSENESNKFLHQVLSGVEYCHKLNIAHRDLKPENMLLDHKNNIKIVDFGLSNTFSDQDKSLTTPCGSPCYAAPEMVAGLKYEGVKTDIWSLGVVLFAFICGYLPFEDPSTKDLYKKIMTADYEIPQEVSPLAADLISRMLTTDPEQRITIEEIKEHPWYCQYTNSRYPQGIIPGVHMIPIDKEILGCMEMIGFDAEATRNSLEANEHNTLTTTYNLMVKRVVMEGGVSISDIGSPYFSPRVIKKQTEPLSPKAQSEGKEFFGKESVSSAVPTTSPNTAESSKKNETGISNSVTGGLGKNQLAKILGCDSSTCNVSKMVFSTAHSKTLKNGIVLSKNETFRNNSGLSKNIKERKKEKLPLSPKKNGLDVTSPNFFTGPSPLQLICEGKGQALMNSDILNLKEKSSLIHRTTRVNNSSLKTIGPSKSIEINNVKSNSKIKRSPPKYSDLKKRNKTQAEPLNAPRKTSNEFPDAQTGQSFLITQHKVSFERLNKQRSLSPKSNETSSMKNETKLTLTFKKNHIGNQFPKQEIALKSPGKLKDEPSFFKKDQSKIKMHDKLKETLNFERPRPEKNVESVFGGKFSHINKSYNPPEKPREIEYFGKNNQSYRFRTGDLTPQIMEPQKRQFKGLLELRSPSNKKQTKTKSLCLPPNVHKGLVNLSLVSTKNAKELMQNFIIFMSEKKYEFRQRSEFELECSNGSLEYSLELWSLDKSNEVLILKAFLRIGSQEALQRAMDSLLSEVSL